MTETLAKIYVKQQKFKEALYAYRILSLKYPEKSSLFANQIKNYKRNKIKNMSIFSIFVLLILFVCFLLVLVIMVQNPKGGGLSSSFGGGGQQMGGVQKTTDFLDRSTWILSTLLLILILLSNFGLETNTSSLPSDSKLIDESEIEIIPETLPEEIFEENNNSNSED